jgi:uridine kinase
LVRGTTTSARVSPAALAGQTVIAAVRRLLTAQPVPILVALDGPSGSGKSSVARIVAEALDVTVVPGDDFFAAGITDAEWASRSPRDRAADAVDWRRLRREALEPLLRGTAARWHGFDFHAGTRPDGSYARRTDFMECPPAPVIVLDGAYSARPELADLIDLAVLVDAPAQIRHERLARREAASFLEAWHARWDSAEAYYFAHVRPASSFDLVVSTAPQAYYHGG